MDHKRLDLARAQVPPLVQELHFVPPSSRLDRHQSMEETTILLSMSTDPPKDPRYDIMGTLTTATTRGKLSPRPADKRRSELRSCLRVFRKRRSPIFRLRISMRLRGPRSLLVGFPTTLRTTSQCRGIFECARKTRERGGERAPRLFSLMHNTHARTAPMIPPGRRYPPRT